MIDLTNRSNLEMFVRDNIEEYNNCHGNFSAKKLKLEIQNQLGLDEEAEFTDSEIGIYLAEKLRELLNNVGRKNAFDLRLNALTGSKGEIDSDILSIANAEILSFSDLKKYYEAIIMQRIQVTYVTSKKFKTDVLKRVLAYNVYATAMYKSTQSQIDYIKSDLRCSIEKALYLVLANGFINKRIDVNTGTKVANEGDSAQFLFLARAVLAGYTCSNVDVRSARYDAVIDYEGHLLRVQIKGISGPSIYLRDRDRGGAGIDPTARRNRGRVISSNDADLYVAVDKQFGICYIIPTVDIDTWVASGKKTVAISRLDRYKENWEKISETAHRLFP